MYKYGVQRTSYIVAEYTPRATSSHVGLPSLASSRACPGLAADAMTEAPLLGIAPARRIGVRHMLVVLAIAVTQCIGAQIAAVVVHAHSAAFLVWFSTGWNMLLFAPLFASKATRTATCAPGCARSRVTTLVFVAPFYALWLCSNMLYVQSLATLHAAIVSALFSVTPGLVALLSVPLLRRRLTIFALLSCLVSASGVVLIAQPWTHTSGHHSLDAAPPAAPPSAPAPAPLFGAFASTLFVLGAAACAATYKVLFRRWHGDAPATTVITVLGCIGVWSATVGTPLLLLFDPKAFSSAAASGASAAAALSLTPAMIWLGVCARATMDLAFNFSIAWGISLIEPLFISIGTLLATPLNVLATFALHRVVPSTAEWLGMLLVLLGFAILLIEERQQAARADAQAMAQAGKPIDGPSDAGPQVEPEEEQRPRLSDEPEQTETAPAGAPR